MADSKNPYPRYREVGGRNVLCSRWLWWELENTLKIELPKHVTECVITLYTQPDFLVKINCTYSPTEQVVTPDVEQEIWEKFKLDVAHNPNDVFANKSWNAAVKLSEKIASLITPISPLFVSPSGLDTIEIEKPKIFFSSKNGDKKRIQFCPICNGKGEIHTNMHHSLDFCSNCAKYRIQGYPLGTVPFDVEQETDIIQLTACHGCGVKKDHTKLEVYSYPGDDLIDCSEPVDPLLCVACEPIEGYNIGVRWLEALVCHECYHKLAPDVWINREEWDKLNPTIKYEDLPLYIEPKL